MALWVTIAEPANGQETQTEAEPTATLGAPAGFAAADQPRHVWLMPGTRLHEQPDTAANIMEILDVPHELEVLQTQGEWLRVRHGTLKAWVRMVEGELPNGDDAIPRLDLTPDPFLADGEHLARAMALLGVSEPERTIGGYPLYTDVADLKLLERLATLAIETPLLYQEMLGLDHGTITGEVIVLFADEDDYAAYLGPDSILGDLDTGGHAGHAIAAVVVGDRTIDGVSSIFVHELVHLMNHRVFGFDLPSWLEEGLANGLAFSRVDRQARFEPDRLDGIVEVTEQRRRQADGRSVVVMNVRVTGALAALRQLLASRQTGSAPPLSRLVTLSLSEFVAADRRQACYSESGFFVRFLLQAEPGDHGMDLRHYLQTVLHAPAPESVPTLDLDWPIVEARFDVWLRRQAVSHGLRP